MNIILVAVDTLRAQNMSCYGYGLKTTPNLERIARNAATFTAHSSHAHNTHPSFTTIFTGNYAETHRVVRMNGEYKIEPGFEMLTELLARHGVQTAAVDDLVSTGAMVKATWFGRGFKTYVNTRDYGGKEGRSMASLRRLAFPILKDLREKKPFFLFLHPWDTHSPYRARPGFNEAFSDGDPTDRVDLSGNPMGCDKFRVFVPGEDVDEEDMRYTLAIYDGAVKEVDHEFSGLLDDVDDLGLLEDTTVIFTSDHGECLGDHRICFGHRWVYDATTRVPLVIISPELTHGRRIETVTQHVDLAPTILDLMGLEIPKNLEGNTLLPLMMGETKQSYPYAHLFGTYPDLRRGLRTDKYKYMEHVATCPRFLDWPTRELYDLDNDPEEEENVIDSHENIADEMRSKMQAWLRSKLGGRVDPMVEQARQGFIEYDN